MKTTKLENTDPPERSDLSSNDLLAGIEQKIQRVEEMHQNLIRESDLLAEFIGEEKDLILAKVFPMRAMDRRNLYKLREWVISKKQEIEEQVQAEDLKRRRQELVDSLNLSDEQWDLLFGG